MGFPHREDVHRQIRSNLPNLGAPREPPRESRCKYRLSLVCVCVFLLYSVQLGASVVFSLADSRP